VLLAMLDKHRTYELARAAGVPAPKTALLGPGDDLAAAPRASPFRSGSSRVTRTCGSDTLALPTRCS